MLWERFVLPFSPVAAEVKPKMEAEGSESEFPPHPFPFISRMVTFLLITHKHDCMSKIKNICWLIFLSSSVVWEISNEIKKKKI